MTGFDSKRQAAMDKTMTRPVESDYTSQVAYTRALEAYCDTLAQPEQKPLPKRRWKLAPDGFGLQRDDVIGNYVHIDDCLSVLHTTPPKRQPQPVQEPVAYVRGLLASRLTCWHRLTGAESDELVALFQAMTVQEPVAWAVVGDGKFGKYEIGQVFVDYEATHIYWENRGYELVPVYTTPPKREWVGLTAQEAADCWTTSATKTWHNFEAALKEKNA